jgi:hypothetical protein
VRTLFFSLERNIFFAKTAGAPNRFLFWPLTGTQKRRKINTREVGERSSPYRETLKKYLSFYSDKRAENPENWSTAKTREFRAQIPVLQNPGNAKNTTFQRGSFYGADWGSALSKNAIIEILCSFLGGLPRGFAPLLIGKSMGKGAQKGGVPKPLIFWTKN